MREVGFKSANLLTKADLSKSELIETFRTLYAVGVGRNELKILSTIKAGRVLNKLRAQVKTGWAEFCRDSLGIPEPTARDYRRLASLCPKIHSEEDVTRAGFKSLSGAYRQLGITTSAKKKKATPEAEGELPPLMRKSDGGVYLARTTILNLKSPNEVGPRLSFSLRTKDALEAHWRAITAFEALHKAKVLTPRAIAAYEKLRDEKAPKEALPC